MCQCPRLTVRQRPCFAASACATVTHLATLEAEACSTSAIHIVAPLRAIYDHVAPGTGLAVFKYESSQISIATIVPWLCIIVIVLSVALAENGFEALAIASVTARFPGLKNIAGRESCHVLWVQHIRAAPLA